MTTLEVGSHQCPFCHYKFDHATEVTSTGRKPDWKTDVSICFGCGSILGFNEDFSPRILDSEEEQNVLEHEVIREAQKAIRGEKCY